MSSTVNDEIERFLRTGRFDAQCGAWSGNFLHREETATRDIKAALIHEVRRRSVNHKISAAPLRPDHVGLTQRKVEPMVRGLFRRIEQEQVLSLLERSVVFVTAESIDELIGKASWPHSAWTIANLYLGSIRGELLGPEAPSLVGLSEGTTCYLTDEYWQNDNKFADFLVHEVAHVFHNCKRATAGLPKTRTREFLLNIDFNMRETFAYACEAYSRILELSSSRTDRHVLLAELLEHGALPDDRVNWDDYLDILTEAVGLRNGWKCILTRCAPGYRK